jgi:hypothetical protein
MYTKLQQAGKLSLSKNIYIHIVTFIQYLLFINRVTFSLFFDKTIAKASNKSSFSLDMIQMNLLRLDNLDI